MQTYNGSGEIAHARSAYLL